MAHKCIFHEGFMPSSRMPYDFITGASLMAKARGFIDSRTACLMMVGPKWENGAWRRHLPDELSIWILIKETDKKSFQDNIPADCDYQINVWQCQDYGIVQEKASGALHEEISEYFPPRKSQGKRCFSKMVILSLIIAGYFLISIFMRKY